MGRAAVTSTMTIVTAAIVVVLLPASVVAARVVGDQQTSQRNVASSPTSEARSAGQAEGESPTLSPATVPVPPPPAENVDLGPSVAPDARMGPSTATDDGREPGWVEVPFTPGQSSWSVVSNGVGLSMQIDPASPKAGDVVHFSIDISTSQQPCCEVSLLFGDGFQTPQGHGYACPDGGSPGSRHFEFDHAYNQAGRMGFTLYGFPSNCTATDRHVGTLYGFLEVVAGSSTPQGPSLPSFEGGPSVAPQGHEGDTSYVTVAGVARDEDGFVTSVVIDWGDGSPVEPHPGDTACQPSPSGWPLPSQAVLFTGSNEHHYSHARSYTVTVSVVSSGCNGQQQQVGSAAFSWQAA